MSKYKSYITSFLLFAAITVTLAGCSSRSDCLYPYGWKKTDPETDSIVLALEKCYSDRAPKATADSLTALLAIRAKANGNNEDLSLMACYWDAVAMRHAGQSEVADSLLQSTVSSMDSAAYPFMHASFMHLLTEDLEPTPELFDATLRRADYFRSVGALRPESECLVRLGTMLNVMGDPHAALDYYGRADSVMKIYGDRERIVTNRGNRATALAQMGDYAKATAELRQLLKHPSVASNPLSREITDWNIYLYSDDFTALRDAYSIAAAASVGSDITWIKLYEALIAKEYALRNMPDSAAVYAGRAAVHPVEWPFLNLEKDYDFAMGHAALSAGDTARAADLFLQSAILADSIAMDNMHARITEREHLRRIEQNNHREEMARATSRIHLVTVVLILLLFAGLAGWLLLRRLHSQRAAALTAELNREHTMRKVLGLRIAMADNDRLVDDLRRDVEALPDVDASVAALRRSLLDTLNAHNLGNSSRENFMTNFAEMRPDFSTRLARAYPGLSDAETRLAVMVALGLDNKHISRLMNIRPESVKQARWRLRSHMRLDKEESLESALQSLMR